MKKVIYSDEQLRLAARLYYVDGVGQSEVAEFVNVSQAKVSRLLSAARERGIVQITIQEYNPFNPALEEHLRRELGLKTIAVIKTAETATDANARRAVGHFGAPIIDRLLPANGVVAVAGGRTIRDVVQALPEDRERRLTVVQAMGSIDSHIGPVDAFELGRAMARRYHGLFLALNTPAFVPDKKTRDSLRDLSQIGSVWRRLDQADSALVGVGTLENSVFADRGVLSAVDLDKLKRQGAIGEICGRFFDAAGRECESPWRDRVISIDLESIRRIPQVVCAVAGGDRAAALTAAIHGGLVKSLVIDELGAGLLLAHLRSSPRSARPRPRRK